MNNTITEKPSDLGVNSSGDLGFFCYKLKTKNEVLNMNKYKVESSIPKYMDLRSVYGEIINGVSKNRSLNTGNLSDKCFGQNVDRISLWIYNQKENPKSLFWRNFKNNGNLFQDLGKMFHKNKIIQFPMDLEVAYRSQHLNYISYKYYEMDDPDCFFCTGCDLCISDTTGEQIEWVADMSAHFKMWRNAYLKEVNAKFTNLQKQNMKLTEKEVN